MNILDLEDQLDEKTKLLISKMEKEIESKDKEIDDLKKELSFLKGQILNKNRKFLDNLVNKLIQDSSHFLMMLKKTVILKYMSLPLKKLHIQEKNHLLIWERKIIYQA